MWAICYSTHPHDCIHDSLGSVGTASSPVANIQSTSFLPVLGEGAAHVTLQPLDGPDHQEVHWNKGMIVSSEKQRDTLKRNPISQCGTLSHKILPLTFPMVCLEFRPIMGSVTTPLSLPLSKKEEERRQAVPTCPGWTSPWTTCSLRSSCEQTNAAAFLLLPLGFVRVNHDYKLHCFFQKWVYWRQISHE